jgi:O-antigen/teichoic acid export membrane protein
MSNEESYLNESLRKIVKGAGFVLIGTLIGRAFGYGSRLIIARLGASDYGLVALGFAVMSIAATLSMVGMTQGVIRYVSFYKGKEDKGRIKGTIISTLKITLPLSLILAFVLFWQASWISIHVFHDANLTPILRIFAIGIPFSVLASNLLSTTVGFQDMRYNVYAQYIFQEPLKLAAIVVLLLLGFGVLGAAWGWVLAIIAMSFLAFYFLEKNVFPIFKTKVKAVSVDKELLSFSLPLLFAGIAGLIMGWTDTLMLGYFSSSADVGIYNVALPTAQLIRAIPGALGVIFFPVISELYARNKIEDLRRTYSVVTKWMLALICPPFLLVLLFPDQIIKILFGAEYIAGATALSILVFGFMIGSVVGPASQTLQAYGRTKTVMMTNYIGAAINFLLNLLLIPIYGVNGAAIATGFSLALLCILNFLFAYRVAKIQPFRLSYLKIILASLIAVFVVYLLTKYVIGVSPLALIAMLFVFLALYLFLLLLMKSFEEQDLMIMRAIDERLGTKSDWARKIIQKFL